MYQVKTLADSTYKGNRLWTCEITFPRFIQAEFKTHRDVSGNAASSRAIPSKKMWENILADPVLPIFRKNQAGMVAGDYLTQEEQARAEELWLKGMRQMVALAQEMADPNGLNIHKSWTSRLTEPWMWITNIASATNWNHLFKLRTAPDAQPEFKTIADMMYDEYHSHQTRYVEPGEIYRHRPMINYDEDRKEVEAYWDYSRSDKEIEATLDKVAIGRIARVSYLTHDGIRSIEKDLELCDRLITSGHFSPMEHVAYPHEGPTQSNFRGWMQYRKFIPNEHVTNWTK